MKKIKTVEFFYISAQVKKFRLKKTYILEERCAKHKKANTQKKINVSTLLFFLRFRYSRS